MLRVGFVQSSPVFGDAAANRRRLAAHLERLDLDLVVLPELCHSGYVFSSRREAFDLAEPIPTGPTCQLLLEVASAKRMIIVAGICERAGDRVFNSAAVLGPRGHLSTYRKIHLFGEEKLWFEPGDTPFRVLDLGDLRLGVLVCYDWRFPEATRALALAGADIIAHPANLVLPQCQDVMRARCIENRVFAITANRVGSDVRRDGRSASFTGRSQVVNPDGDLLARASADHEEIGVAAASPLEARRKTINDHNHLLKDRRPEFYAKLLG